MKLSKKLLTVIMCIGLLFSNTAAFAHSGRTDSSGGHHDYNNVSGLGSYHYHHGMGRIYIQMEYALTPLPAAPQPEAMLP